MKLTEKSTLEDIRACKQKAIESYANEMEFINKKIRAINKMRQKLKTSEKILTARTFNNVPGFKLKSGTSRGSKIRYLSLGCYHIFWFNGYIRLRKAGGFGSHSIFSITQLREDHEIKFVVEFMEEYGSKNLIDLYTLIQKRESLIGKFSHIGPYYPEEEVPILNLETLEICKDNNMMLEGPRKGYVKSLTELELSTSMLKIPIDYKFKESLLALPKFQKHLGTIDEICEADQKIQNLLDTKEINKILMAELI